MKIRTYAFVWSTLASLLILSGCGKKSPEELIVSAKQEIQAEQHQKAVVSLKSALQDQPDNPEARLLLGQDLQSQSEWSARASRVSRCLWSRTLCRATRSTPCRIAPGQRARSEARSEAMHPGCRARSS